MNTYVENFKGFPILKMETEPDYNGYSVKLTFGLTKAKMILANLDAIRDFVEKYDRI